MTLLDHHAPTIYEIRLATFRGLLQLKYEPA